MADCTIFRGALTELLVHGSFRKSFVVGLSMIDIENLKNYSLFGGMTPEAIETIQEYLVESNYAPGQNIVLQGERSESLYLIIEGSVSVLVDDTLISRLHEGESFGEMHLIDIMPRSATVRADTDVTTLSLCNRDIIELKQESINTYLMIIMNCARTISRRLRTTNAAYVKLLQEKKI